MKRRMLPTLAILVSTAAAVLTACSAPSATTASSEGQTTLRVASIDVDGSIPLIIAQEQGFFDDRGIKVETTMSPAFDGTLASVMNGQADIGFAASPPLLNALAKKAPVQVVAQTASTAVGEMEANVDVYGEGIQRPKDLEGRTVAVTSLNDLGAVGIRLSVAKDGGDPSKVKIVELPGPQRLGALVEGRIDAAVLLGPAAVAARETDNVRVLFNYTDGLPAGSPLDVYFATPQFIEANGDALKKFRAALDDAVAYANDNPDVVRAALAKLFKDIEGGEEAAKTVRLMNYSTGINPDALMELQNGLTTYGKLAGVTPADGFYSYSQGE